MLFVDEALSRRIERAEATANARFVVARNRLEPDLGACYREFDGTYAMFDGAASPVTQTFGLGLFAQVTESMLTEIEQFFEERGAGVSHEVSPLADDSALVTLNARRYKPCELSSILFQELHSPKPDSAQLDGSSLTVRRIRHGEQQRWAEVSAAGWAEYPALREFLLQIGLVWAHSEGAMLFFAEQEGVPIATAALSVGDRVAHLAGASTIPSARGRGAQQMLLAARLQTARALGCELAVMAARPGSRSQRNAERNGFRIAYTRIKWTRDTR